MVNKNKHNNSSNSLVFGLWPQTNIKLLYASAPISVTNVSEK